MKKKQNKYFKYKVYSYRLDDKTWKRLKKLKIKEGVSWNILFNRMGDSFEGET
jgi:hypothetical protein